MSEPTPADAATAARSSTRSITLHYFMTNMGLFGLLSTLAVSLTAAGFSGGQTGFLILVFTIANKVSKVPLARWLDRISAALSVLLGCLTAAVGFTGLRIAGGLTATAVTLALAGLGVSVNALASKQLAAEASDRSGDRARLFSLINIAVNVASALAAPVALFFVQRHQHDLVLSGVSAVYCLAGLTTFLNYRRLRMDGRVRAPDSSLRGYLDILALPGMRSFMLINLLGWCCYGQLFNALALHVSSDTKATDRLGWLYTLNALLIVVAQLGVTRLTEKLSKGRQTITTVAAYTTFALAFTTVYLIPGFAGAVVGVVLFTVGEMMFVPTMDVLLLRLLGDRSRALGYGVFSIGNALGEAVGGGLGVAVYRWLGDDGRGADFWLFAAGLALLSALLTQRLRVSSPGLRALTGHVKPAVAVD
ncbi:MFS transporter [Streptomyces sp. LMG1-1-1.1]|uniref:MFS transporter n=1 Tax=Streptomyces sp. LMG1-1-1.1 TaxID=3135245 RepID=UPI0034659A0D